MFSVELLALRVQIAAVSVGPRVAAQNFKASLRLCGKALSNGIHWKQDGKIYYDEVSAESKEEAVEYFIDHKRDDVTLVRIELVGPNEGGVREFAHAPILPFGPLTARRRLDQDEDAR